MSPTLEQSADKPQTATFFFQTVAQDILFRSHGSMSLTVLTLKTHSIHILLTLLTCQNASRYWFSLLMNKALSAKAARQECF